MAEPAYTTADNPNPANLVAELTDDTVTTFTVRPRGIYCGVAGNIAAYFSDAPNTAIVFRGVIAGTLLPIRPIKIGNAAAGTSATKLIALF